jgi:hypothetical protein
MNAHDISLVVAGVIGSGVAIVHGVLTQRLLVKPTLELSISSLARKLNSALLQFSTFNWFVSGPPRRKSGWPSADRTRNCRTRSPRSS